jgi:hypothetical protein
MKDSTKAFIAGLIGVWALSGLFSKGQTNTPPATTNSRPRFEYQSSNGTMLNCKGTYWITPGFYTLTKSEGWQDYVPYNTVYDRCPLRIGSNDVCLTFCSSDRTVISTVHFPVITSNVWSFYVWPVPLGLVTIQTNSDITTTNWGDYVTLSNTTLNLIYQCQPTNQTLYFRTKQ